MTGTDSQPAPSADGAILATILHKQGEMSVQLAIIGEAIKAVTDHEARIRKLESAKATIVGAAVAAGTLSGAVATLVYWALSRR